MMCKRCGGDIDVLHYSGLLVECGGRNVFEFVCSSCLGEKRKCE